MATLSFFYLCFPGGDTQVKRALSDDWYQFVSQVHRVSRVIILTLMSLSSQMCLGLVEQGELEKRLNFVWFSTIFWLVPFLAFTSWITPIMSLHTGVFYDAVDRSLRHHKSRSTILRKHGRWKCKDAYPSKWILLSSIMLMPCQVSSFVDKGLHAHHRPCTGFFASGRASRSNHMFHPDREWIPFFNDCYSLAPVSSLTDFYRHDLIDHVFSDHGLDKTSVIRPAPLHLQGSIIASEWMESMGKKAAHSLHFGSPSADFDLVDDAHVDDLITFKSIERNEVQVYTPFEHISEDLSLAIRSLPSQPVALMSSASQNHIVDIKHFLRLARERLPNQKDVLDESKVFSILIDTGCSVSCSGFAEDFHGELAYGDFGHVSTADGRAKIEGFGILRWDIISDMGLRQTILVPGYFSPTVQLRLLSPQDYNRYHHMDNSVPQYSGNSDWMYMNLHVPNVDDEGSRDVKHVAFANIDSASRLPFLFGELGYHDVKGGIETKCHCNVTSIYDVRNVNLTDAQKKLKLDHDRLGHLSMQAIQRL